jgi:hypothetical protein
MMILFLLGLLQPAYAQVSSEQSSSALTPVQQLNSQFYAVASRNQVHRNRDFAFPLAAGIAFEELRNNPHADRAQLLSNYHQNYTTMNRLLLARDSHSNSRAASAPTGSEQIALLAAAVGSAAVLGPAGLAANLGAFGSGLALSQAAEPLYNHFFPSSPAQSDNQMSFERDWEPALISASQLGATSDASQFERLETSVYSAGSRLAHASPENRLIIEEITQNHIDVSPSSSASELLAHDPGLRHLPHLAEITNIVQRIEHHQEVDSGRMDHLLHELQSDADRSLREAGAHGVSAQPVLAKKTHAQATAQEQRRSAAEVNLQKIELLDAAGDLVTGIFKVTGLGNTRAGHVFETVFQSTLQLAKIEEKFKAGVDEVGATILTLNAASVFVNIASLFIEPGPTPDQMILNSIANLQHAVEQLGTQMHTRFDRIDSKLNQMMAATHEGFHLLLVQGHSIQRDVTQTQRQVAEVQQRLFNLGLQMDQFQVNLRDMIRAGFNEAIEHRIALCLAQHNEHIRGLSYESFHQCKVQMIQHATQVATQRRSVASLPDNRILDLALLKTPEFSQFLRNPLTTSLDGLAQIARGLFGNQAMHTEPSTAREAFVPNAAEWYLGANAYLKLVHQYPEYKSLADPQEINPLIVFGGRIKSSTRAITQIPGERGSRPNSIFFENMIHAYREQATQLIQGFNLEQTQIQAASTHEVDPWGSMDQNVLLDAGATLVSNYCDPAGPRFTQDGIKKTVPREVLKLLPKAYRLAVRLKMGTLTICHGQSSTNSHAVHFPLTFKYDDKIVETVLISLPLSSEVTGVTHPEYWNKNNVSIVASMSPNQNPGPATLVEQVTAKLVEKQKEVATTLLQRSIHPSIQDLILGLSNTQKLLQDYVLLGLPQTIQTNDLLRGDFFGDQKLPDQEVITQWLQGCTIGCQEGPLKGLENLIESRSQAFLQHVEVALNASSGNEIQASLGNTLEELSAYRNHIQLSAHRGSPAEAVQSLRTFIAEFRRTHL